MTATELIEQIDELVPNPFSEAAKLALVNEIEGKLQTELLLIPARDVTVIAAADADSAELLLPPARAPLYLAWMRSMIYWMMGEYEIYENEKAMFNAEWEWAMRDACIERDRSTICGSTAPTEGGAT